MRGGALHQRSPRLGPLPGLPFSRALTEGVETSTQEQVRPRPSDTQAVTKTTNRMHQEAVPPSPTFVAQRRLYQQRACDYTHVPTISKIRPKACFFNVSDFPLSHTMSLQTGIGRFSQYVHSFCILYFFSGRHHSMASFIFRKYLSLCVRPV
ncbi:hypothetical protein H4582DRAFT_147425 [Lactarius indigo]|nr:hypothetical protein H4582DRAFT_147425 [Lactarius indigo]